MQLHALLRLLDAQIRLADVPNVPITGVCEDSRKVAAGNLFIARRGTQSSGVEFITDAQLRGAAAVVSETAISECALPQVIVADAARATSLLANYFHGKPSRAMRCLAITGTNGKTTTTYLLRHLLAKARERCGLVGTVEIDDGRARREAEMTTPSACDVAAMLAAMRDNGCSAAAIEASSHALEQSRLAGVQFAGAAFTNLTGDHLDYHKTMDAYAAAKAKLFESLDAEATAVINDDDSWSNRMIENCPSRIIRFGFGPRAHYRAGKVQITAQGSRFELIAPGGRADVQMKLIGKHNIENALAATALAAEVCGVSINQIAAGLGDAGGAPGRLEAVELGQPFAVLVDYAHTDDALENVLSALRPLAKGKLRVLFGCGGDRDPHKRPRMAKVSERYGDAIYVTSDNPRTEDPMKIIEQIVPGFSKSQGKPVVIEADRRAAIERIIADARPGDVVLIAGKGHENYQVVGTQKHHFDDLEEARRVIQGLAAAA